MKNILTILLSFLLFGLSAQAKVSVLFHPYDDTFSAIVERLKTAEESIDLALYNLDATDRSSIIRYFKSQNFQKKLKQGDLKVRLIFEGYASKEENLEKMLELEKIGLDARALSSSKKMHHKFAIIDGHKADASVITGSANWSSSSRDNYNENIIFFDREGSIAQDFQEEFNFLWNLSKEVGTSQKHQEREFEKAIDGIGKAYFNKQNFSVSRGRLSKKRGDIGYHLTKQIVRAIDSADEKIEIATTRLKLRPIYNAVLRAAKRGIEVKLVVTMGEYEWASKRKKLKEKTCSNEFESKCSSGVNYAALLSGQGFEGHENVEVRLKFFHLKTSAYLSKQMHSKYLIIDEQVVLSGSFNWSYSSEFSHIENIVEINQRESKEVLKEFNKDFDILWGQGREKLSHLHERISATKKAGEKMDCGFDPMSLSYEEIDSLLRRGTKFCL